MSLLVKTILLKMYSEIKINCRLFMPSIQTNYSLMNITDISS